MGNKRITFPKPSMYGKNKKTKINNLMRKILSSYIFSLALGFLLMPTAFAETESAGNDYRIPLYDKIDFKAEQSGANKVSMSWSAFKGHNDEVFEYYKVIRSYSNPNPVYPEQNAMAVKSKVGDLRHTDENAWKSAHYRVCAITNKKERYCSNVVWVEIEKKATISRCEISSADQESSNGKDCGMSPPDSENDCQNFAHDGNCADQAKAQLAEKKEKIKLEREAKQKAQVKERAVKKSEKKSEMAENRVKQQEALYEKLYTKLDKWLERFGAKLEQSNISSTKKVERIEMIQVRFASWEKGKSVRIKMVAYLNKTLNEWKMKYSAGDEFEEIDAFLEGLLD